MCTSSPGWSSAKSYHLRASRICSGNNQNCDQSTETLLEMSPTSRQNNPCWPDQLLISWSWFSRLKCPDAEHYWTRHCALMWFWGYKGSSKISSTFATDSRQFFWQSINLQIICDKSMFRFFCARLMFRLQRT